MLFARGLIRLMLRLTGFAGVTLPWAIYLLPERLVDDALCREAGAVVVDTQAEMMMMEAAD